MPPEARRTLNAQRSVLLGVALAVAVFAPNSALGQIIFEGLYDSGPLGGWTGLHAKECSRLTISGGTGSFLTPTQDFSTTGHSTTRWRNSCTNDGSITESARNMRTEVYWDDSTARANQAAGQTLWYRWKTNFNGYPTLSTDGFQIFTQFKDDTWKSPPVALDAKMVGSQEKLVVDVLDYSPTADTCSSSNPCDPTLDPNERRVCENGFCLNDRSTISQPFAALNRTDWNEFVMRVNWSNTGGDIKVWHRVGNTAFSSTAALALQGRNMRSSGDSLYVKQGLYRGRTDVDNVTRTIVHDNFRAAEKCTDLVYGSEQLPWCNVYQNQYSLNDSFTYSSIAPFVCVDGTCGTSFYVAEAGLYDISFGPTRVWYSTSYSSMKLQLKLMVDGNQEGVIEERDRLDGAFTLVRSKWLSQGTHYVELQARTRLVSGPPDTVWLKGYYGANGFCASCPSEPVTLKVVNTW